LADCTQTYGGSQSCTSSNFSIEKMVQVPGKSGGDYVDNLSINDSKYSPSNTVNFKIIVKNTGNSDISSLTVSDKFPQFLSFVSGPGSFNTNTGTLTFVINNFKAGDSQTFFVTGKIADENMLPSDQGIICLINQGQATDNNGLTNTSQSQFCIQKSVLGTTQPQVLTAANVTSTPATGPEMLPLISLIPGGIAGLILKKKSIKN
jgi:uncharacterized repeat protein (TIGR01451 family)